MAFTVRTAVATPNTDTTAVETGHDRLVRVWNNGPALVWLGDSDVTDDRGTCLAPGDPPYVHAHQDGLFHVTRAGQAQLTIVEET